MKYRWPPAWMLVLTGLVLNVMAILMSSIVLEKQGSKISVLEEQKQDNLYSIQLTWNRVESLERKKELTLLYLHQRSLTQTSLTQTERLKVIDNILTEQLSDWLVSSMPELAVDNIPHIFDLIEKEQLAQRKKIDDFYLGNLSINEQLIRLNESMAWYRNISLFLQVFGLALILARDLEGIPVAK
ncbi:DNA mismatch repair protein [Vibrio kasasachensis]|uniref:DNA mismatch repair protein n=1 Tax=Vibrio kasasachensis TaxID=2910248 RepID=UPI003D142901